MVDKPDGGPERFTFAGMIAVPDSELG